MTIAIGLEGSANKLGVGIVRDGVVLSNPVKTYIPAPGEDFSPKEAAGHHQRYILQLVDQALEEAEINYSDVDVVCYNNGPGMGAPLVTISTMARAFSQLWNKPLVGVNHCIGHIEIGRLTTGADNPIVLYVSGESTQLLTYGDKQYKILGQTTDISVGNCLDRFARALKLSNDPSPGYNIEQMAKRGKKWHKFPCNLRGMDISLSGLVAYIEEKVDTLLRSGFTKEDLCSSLQKTLFTVLVEVTERALAHCDSNEVLLVGGVCCNKLLQQWITSMVQIRKGKVYATDERFCSDNGAMIAQAGLQMYRCGQVTDLREATYNLRFRTDEVEVTWRD